MDTKPPVLGTSKMSLLHAIARQEGYYEKGTRAQRNHNPGNINAGTFARMHGSTGGDDKGYAVFPDDSTGFAALGALLKTVAYKGHTLKDVINRYCPPTGDVRGNNDTSQYVKNVSSWTGIAPTDVIDTYV